GSADFCVAAWYMPSSLTPSRVVTCTRSTSMAAPVMRIPLAEREGYNVVCYEILLRRQRDPSAGFDRDSASGGGRVQPRCAADTVRSVLPVSRSRQGETQ